MSIMKIVEQPRLFLRSGPTAVTWGGVFEDDDSEDEKDDGETSDDEREDEDEDEGEDEATADDETSDDETDSIDPATVILDSDGFTRKTNLSAVVSHKHGTDSLTGIVIEHNYHANISVIRKEEAKAIYYDKQEVRTSDTIKDDLASLLLVQTKSRLPILK